MISFIQELMVKNEDPRFLNWIFFVNLQASKINIKNLIIYVNSSSNNPGR